MGLVGEICLAISRCTATRSARRGIRSSIPRTLIEHLANFAELSSGIVKEIEIRRDGKWGKRLLKDRAAVAEAMEGFMERAPKEIAAALPTLKSGSYGGGPQDPGFLAARRREKAERGLRYARLVVGCKLLPRWAPSPPRRRTRKEQACQQLRSYNEDLVKELRSAGGRAAPSPNASSVSRSN